MKGSYPWGESLALLTDIYELTMAQGYWKTGCTGKEAAFHLHFRSNPFGGGFAVAAGLEPAVDAIEGFRFDASDAEFLLGIPGNDGRPIFEEDFLEYLVDLRLTVDLDAVPEGTVVFPEEPLLRVTGPILEAQILETLLLNQINFPTLVATKSARICRAAGGSPVFEFGLRRAQGIDGALSASRAAYIGGSAATSNALASKLYGIPSGGTLAHSWIASFADEREAFRLFAEAMPANCIFLVDTYDSLQGVTHAIEAGRALRARGHEMTGIRLDSGDLASLSREARRRLDLAGFPKALIVGSNDLDEHAIARLVAEGAPIQVWGIGTRLVTAHDQPALGGVYKLSSIREPGGEWEPRVKLSEETGKTTTPGRLQVRRYRSGARCLRDAIWDEDLGIASSPALVDPAGPTPIASLPASSESEDLLVPILRKGRRVWTPPSLRDVRVRAKAQLEGFPEGVRRLADPDRYPVGLESRLHEMKSRLLSRARSGKDRAP